MKRRYPLESLAQLRKREAEARAHALAREHSERLRAEASLARAEHRKLEHQAATRAGQQRERARVEAGEALARDLQLTGGWVEQQKRTLLVLAEQERVAAGQLEQAREAELGAQRALVEADAAVKVVQRHRGGWEKKEAARAERRAEDDAPAHSLRGTKC